MNIGICVITVVPVFNKGYCGILMYLLKNKMINFDLFIFVFFLFIWDRGGKLFSAKSSSNSPCIFDVWSKRLLRILAKGFFY